MKKNRRDQAGTEPHHLNATQHSETHQGFARSFVSTQDGDDPSNTPPHHHFYFSQNGDGNEQKFLTVEQVADFLRLSERTLLRMIKENKLPARKFGRHWRIPEERFREWIDYKESKTL